MSDTEEEVKEPTDEEKAAEAAGLTQQRTELMSKFNEISERLAYHGDPPNESLVAERDALSEQMAEIDKRLAELEPEPEEPEAEHKMTKAEKRAEAKAEAEAAEKEAERR